MIAILSLTLTFLYPVAIDGDTFKWENERVRLWGIDAPEINTSEGRVSATELRYLIEDHELVCDKKGVDGYGRTVAQCWNEAGEDIACIMVGMGLANDWSYFSHGYYKECENEYQ